MRGWTADVVVLAAGHRVFPAHAGMDRNPRKPGYTPLRVPRACGDGPATQDIYSLPSTCSPRMRGWTEFQARGGRIEIRVPRACGDGPMVWEGRVTASACSPRMRGWTVDVVRCLRGRRVFPAHAGMDRDFSWEPASWPGVPRACGDGPSSMPPGLAAMPCSPRMRGWTANPPHHAGVAEVFPAHAGMDRTEPPARLCKPSVPRACGDGPLANHLRVELDMCSPRMRGWTVIRDHHQAVIEVFPAHAGMDRTRNTQQFEALSVPRACGDGPLKSVQLSRHARCSPRMRGWTAFAQCALRPTGVFPAHAGMDREGDVVNKREFGVPRACGDGPTLQHASLPLLSCSPRMRGWTGKCRPLAPIAGVFPAHAGMDRFDPNAVASSISVPRACGDGPAYQAIRDPVAKCSPRMRGWTGGAA